MSGMLTAAAINTAMTAAATLGLCRIRSHPASTATAAASLVTRGAFAP
jgi:hypothetical protein